MKRSSRVLAGLGALGVLLPALIIADAHRRASNAIDRHWRQVEADTAELRARLAMRPQLEWRPFRLALEGVADEHHAYLLEGSPLTSTDARVFLGGFPYETCNPSNGLSPGTSDSSTRSGSRLSVGDCLLVRTALAQELVIGAPLEEAFRRQQWESNLIHLWHTLLQGERLPADSLERYAAVLDRLEAVRRPIRDALDAEHAVQRRAALLILERGDDRFRFLKARPGWRHLFSWKVFISRVIADLEQDYRAASAIADLPMTRWESALKPLEGPSPARLSEVPLTLAPDVMFFERTLAEHRVLRQAAIAVAWYREEQGKFPDSWEALVPRHLPAPPVSPACGTVLTLREGKVYCGGHHGPVWTLKGN